MYRQSRWHEAETHFSRLCDLSSSNVAALRSLALVKFKQNKFDACRQRCNDTLKLDPLNSDALWLLAEMHRQEGAPGDDCWFLGIRSPPEVSVADICQTIAKGYLTRKQAPGVVRGGGSAEVRSKADVAVVRCRTSAVAVPYPCSTRLVPVECLRSAIPESVRYL